MDARRLLEIAKKLKHDVAFESWSTQQVFIWLRDDCRCGYCGEDLLLNRSVAYCMGKLDHLLPKSKPQYRHLENELWNLVLCCGDCNSLKSTWDPNTDGGTPVYFGSDKAPANGDKIRMELIRRTADYLLVKREPLLVRFVREQLLMRRELRRIKDEPDSAANAASGD